MDGVLTPFVINMFYNMGPAGGHIPFVFENDFKIKNDTTPVVENFVFENIICNNISIAAGVFLGLKESMIKSITFKNCSFEYNHNLPGGYPVMIEKPIFMEGEGFYIMNVENFTLDNVKFKNLEKKIIVDDNVNNIVIK